jgi:2'-5' RNA ligase
LGSLAAVAEEAAVAVGLEPEERPFRPHLTLARVRPPEDVERLVSDAPPFSFGWDVGELVLFRSHLGRGGSRYERLDAIKLR